MRRARTINDIEKDHGVHPVQVGPRASIIGTAFWNCYIPEITILGNDVISPLGPKQVNVAADYLVANGVIPMNLIWRPFISVGECIIYELQK